MLWLRANKRSCTGAALFALALQLVLSFGHIHRYDLTRSSQVAVAASQGDTASDDGAPSDRHHSGSGDDFCAICAALNFASSSLLPTLSPLVLPFESAQVWRAEFQSIQIAFDLHFLFQARAPPQFA